MMSQRLAVVDDHVLFAEAMVVALVNVGYDARCVIPTLETPVGAPLVARVLEGAPDVVLLDLDLGGAGDGLDLIEHLAARSVVVVVTGSSDPVAVGKALAAGATTVLSKSMPFEKIVATLVRLRDGLPAMNRQERDRLLMRWREKVELDREVKARFDLLTTREAQVLGQLMAGRQVSEIARRSFVSESTVRTQVKSVLGKLQVNSQLTAVGLAYRARWRAPGAHASGEWNGTVSDLPPPRASA
ncbi:MAG TPA: response regulator transcription factor [Nocardioides sp.]|jgi:two-component system, NarL family, nitrate/nitrite response regulator NarL|nr:response regulator transcription factor [Nocardioides sp.]HEX3297366.1 response regulator transcription factor [Nocardioides sp.]